MAEPEQDLARGRRAGWLVRWIGAPLAPLVDGNRVEPLCDGDSYFGAVEAAIEAARTYLFVETYILKSDRTGWRVARALAEARARGVEVALSYDGYGSIGLSTELSEFLALQRIKVLVFRPVAFFGGSTPWSTRNHRKMLVADGRVAITGGHNLADDYAGVGRGGNDWRDTSCRVEGPAVEQLETIFRRTWRRFSKIPLESAPKSCPPFADGAPMRFAFNFARRQRAQIRREYLAAIISAERSIRITNAYFAPDRSILRALVRAARRGVEVELVLAGNTDVKAVLMVSRGLYGYLMRAGVRIFEWHERILHAKTAVVDGVWTSIGSANLNQRSFRYDLEANAVVVSGRLGAKMDAIFEADRARSRRIVPEEWSRRPAWMRLLEWFFGLFRRIV